ncbi:hypothetical protein T02_7053, partial [Trichinella nativa]
MIVAETIPAEANSHTDSALRGDHFVNLPSVPECTNRLQQRTTVSCVCVCEYVFFKPFFLVLFFRIVKISQL